MHGAGISKPRFSVLFVLMARQRGAVLHLQVPFIIFFESVHMLQPSERIKSSILWHEPDNAREAETGPLAVTNNRAVVLGRTMEAAS